MKLIKIPISIFFVGTACIIAQEVRYKNLKEDVENLAKEGLPNERINIITNGIPKVVQDKWTILLMKVQDYVDFRTGDETENLVDAATTFSNILTIQDLLMKAVQNKAFNPVSAPTPLLKNVQVMIKNKLDKIKNIPVLGLGTQYDLWYLLENLAEFLVKFRARILSDLAKLQTQKIVIKKPQ